MRLCGVPFCSRAKNRAWPGRSRPTPELVVWSRNALHPDIRSDKRRAADVPKRTPPLHSAALPLHCRPKSGGFERSQAEFASVAKRQQNRRVCWEIAFSAATGDPGVEPDAAVLETTVLPIHQSPTAPLSLDG
jgi:hypothetical protein